MWFQKYLNKPWAPMGRGPSEYNCWGLVKRAKLDEQGVVLPEFPEKIKEASENFDQCMDSVIDKFVRIQSPRDKCIVLMSNSRDLHHVGICSVIGGKVSIVHASQKTGSVVDSLGSLRQRGFHNIQFWECRELYID